MEAEGNREALFQSLFDEAQETISRTYISGTRGYIKEKHRSVYESILNAEAEIERLWLAMRQGEDTLGEFTDVLATLERLYLQAVELYRTGEAKQKKLF